MAVSLLPGISTCVPNCRTGSDVYPRECMCRMSSGLASSPSSIASSVLSAAVCDAVSSFQNFSALCSRSAIYGASCARWSYSRTTAPSKARMSSGLWSLGQALIESSIGRSDRKREYFRASATKDSSRDVFLQTDSHETHGPYERMQTPRGCQSEEDMETEGGEKEEKEIILNEEGMLLNTEKSREQDHLQENEKEDSGFASTAAVGTLAAGLGLVLAVGGFGAASIVYKDQINDFLIQFSDFIEGYGPAGYGLFVLVYTGLELLAIPAIPLTMSAGLLFGPVVGTIIVSVSGTFAATGAFLIARYLARDRLLELAKGNKKFLAIDKAIGEDSFRVVTLLRLSPLLPFSLGNYLYGLTSVQLWPYVLGSWLGMLPGSWAYVSAGAIGRAFIVEQESEPVFSGSPGQLWTIGLGLAATVFAATYVTRVAKEALKDIDD